jgi:hypothetical protein
LYTLYEVAALQADKDCGRGRLRLRVFRVGRLVALFNVYKCHINVKHMSNVNNLWLCDVSPRDVSPSYRFTPDRFAPEIYLHYTTWLRNKYINFNQRQFSSRTRKFLWIIFSKYNFPFKIPCLVFFFPSYPVHSIEEQRFHKLLPIDFSLKPRCC